MAVRTFVRFWLALIGLSLTQPAFAQPRDRLAEALALPVASDLAGARDVPRFAWIENEAGVRNIWVATRGQPARKLTAFTDDDGQQLSGLVVSNDGASLAYVRGGDAEFPEQQDLPNTGTAPLTPAQQVFVLAAEGGAPIPLGQGHSPVFSPDGRQLAFTRRGELWLWSRAAKARRIAKVDGQIERLSWSPDGTLLLFSEDRGEHSYVATLGADGQRLTYLDPGFGHSVDPVFSPDGRQVAFIRYLSAPAAAAPGSGGPYWSIRVVDLATGAARILWTPPVGQGGRYAGTRSRNLFWSRDGQILFPWARTDWLHVYALDAAKGGQPRALTGGSFEVETFLIDDARDTLLYAANADHIDRRRVWRRPLRGGAPVRLGSGEAMHFFPALAGGEVAAIATGVSTPAHPVLLGDRTEPLAQVPTAAGFVAPQAVTFRAADGVEIHGQLFRARGKGKRPALLFIHGGPRRQMLLGFHPSSYYSKTYAMNQHLASLGYHVLAVNYRGGTGYGQAFREAPETGREGASEYRDILAAGRWLAAQGDVDPSRIGLWGGSWGGYLTALGLARDSDLFASGVDLHGVHSLLRALPNTLSPDAQAKARQLQWESSPLGAIETWRSPVLLIHGDDDRNVPFAQSLLLARELAARNIPYRELVFPNERHSFFRHDSWLRALRATEDFLDLTLMRKEPLR
ncbi:prolyl oligopeptidase family serine peptidase [Sphingomonas sp. LY54]|uniref:S9 family peptidase n=1 Tax=Sphingomonas sp. LY54 TaxID=3095343 RepID=UPI002D77DB5C|nr:prolyl oligopeptidase family serine peptidase [Sphingomonas sp. LY54]WRP27958.1 prolyl oligopeptidase family serine peptidase [Sphingomonas sp. LY54]